ncbi:hypothetical protein EVA_09299 [gut metagenome]|uniref:Uncharacterized protein n=1 Tax=gut metagenome TaxID=749906 RepID=J9GKH5_9ZZZZ
MAKGPIALNPSSNCSPYPSLLPLILSTAPTIIKIIIIKIITELMDKPETHSLILCVKTSTLVMLSINS